MTTETKFSDRFLFHMVWNQVSKHKSMFWATTVMLVFNVLLGIAGPFMFNTILELVDSEEVFTYSLVTYLIIAYVVFNLLSWVFRGLQFMFAAKLNARVVKGLRDRAFANILENKVSFYDKQKSGELTSRVVNDTRELAEAGRDVTWVITNLFQVTFVLAFFYYLSASIALVATLFIPVIVVISVFMGKWERRVSKVWRERFAEVNARFSDIMSKIAISKAFNREDENLSRFKIINEGTYRASIKRGLAIFLFWPITDLLQHALRLLIISVGIFLIDSQGLSLTTFIMFLVLLGFFYWPVISIAGNYHRFQAAAASLERIARVSEDSVIQEGNGGDKQADSLMGEIEFREVDFSYDGENKVLEQISFTIKPGERVALVGHTGAGKSTIASIMVNFYPIMNGKIYLDGIDINEYDLQSLRKHISLVSQRVLLFKGTIRENLHVSNPHASDEEIWQVLDQVQAREFIELLPEGLDSQVDENGKNLSAGQKQMISFARALLSNPRIIILDEATSAVDLYTEAKIQDAIDTLLSTRTSISIAHRLTTILKSDKIIVLDHGRIVQVGSHAELLEEEGLYAEMYALYLETQSAKYLEKIKVK